MASYTLKSRRVLQLREEFADKREDHEFSVYQRPGDWVGERLETIKRKPGPWCTFPCQRVADPDLG
jgi:hypothetical protein